MDKYYYYEGFELIWKSQVRLLEFKPASSNKKYDIVIRYGKTPSFLRNVSRKGVCYSIIPDKILIRIPKVANFLIKNGKEIIIDPVTRNIADIKTFLLSNILGGLLNQRGLFPMHASAVIINGYGVIFSGISGIGKSTLATTLASKGYKIITDDIAAIKIIDNIPYIIPSFSSIKLWDDSIKELAIDKNQVRVLRKSTNKKILRRQYQYFCDLPVKIRHIFIIQVSNNKALDICEITGLNKFAALKDNTYRIKLIEGESSQLGFFNHLSVLSSTVKVYKITRPKDPFEPEKFADYILNYVISHDKEE